MWNRIEEDLRRRAIRAQSACLARRRVSVRVGESHRTLVLRRLAACSACNGSLDRRAARGLRGGIASGLSRRSEAAAPARLVVYVLAPVIIVLRSIARAAVGSPVITVFAPVAAIFDAVHSAGGTAGEVGADDREREG